MTDEHGAGPETEGIGLQATVGEGSSDGIVIAGDAVGSPDDPFVGRVFKDAYRVEALIGQGGMGAVYQGVQLAVGREVAIKVLRPATFMQEAAKHALIARFRREAVATSVLNHPNTVRLFDFGEHDDGTLFLVLELLRGRSLSQVIRDEGALLPSRAASIGYQICRSLAEAHSAGIIHRDLKPDNVFLCEFEDQSDFVKVMDFGIARVVDSTGTSEGQVTQTGATVGTPAYMAPEQAMASDINPSTDLYSLGIMLYEMLQGRVPFTGDTFMSVALRHLNESPPPLSMPGAPEDILALWQALLDKLLAKVADERPQSAKEVADTLHELERISREAGIKTMPDALGLPDYVRDAGRGKRPDKPITDAHSSEITMAEQEGIRPPRNKKVLVAALAVAGLAAAVVAGVLLSGGTTDKTPKPAAVSADTTKAPNAATMRAAKPEKKPDPVEPKELVPDATPTTSRLSMSTIPEGAEVYRGSTSKPICRTPCDVEIPGGTGPETLLVKLEGYTVKEVTVNLKPGATVRQAVAMAATPRDTVVEPKPALETVKPAEVVPNPVETVKPAEVESKTAARRKNSAKRKKVRKKKKTASKKTAAKKAATKKHTTAAKTPPKKKKKKLFLPKFSGADPTRK